MTVRKLAVLVLPALWIALIIVRLFEMEEPKRLPLKFTSGQVAAADSSSGKGPEKFAVSEDSDHTMPLTPKNIFAPLGMHVEPSQKMALSTPVSHTGEAGARSGRKRATGENNTLRDMSSRVAEADDSPNDSAQTTETGVPSAGETITLSEEFMGPPEPSLEDLLVRARRKAETEVEDWRRQQERIEREATRQKEFAEAQIRQQRESVAQQAKQQREAALQQARQLIAQYRFLGYLEEGDRHQAFLAKGQQLYVVQRGQTVDGRLRIKAVDSASIRLQDAGTKLETTILLSKESPDGS